VRLLISNYWEIHNYTHTRRIQGVQWLHLYPQNGEKQLGVIYRENLQVHPQAEQESIVSDIFVGWEDLESRGGLFSSGSLCFEGDD